MVHSVPPQQSNTKPMWLAGPPPLHWYWVTFCNIWIRAKSKNLFWCRLLGRRKAQSWKYSVPEIFMAQSLSVPMSFVSCSDIYTQNTIQFCVYDNDSLALFNNQGAKITKQGNCRPAHKATVKIPETENTVIDQLRQILSSSSTFAANLDDIQLMPNS